MNNLPPNVTVEQLDSSIYDDGIWELACHLFKTSEPTVDQLNFSIDYQENLAMENLYEE